MCDIADTLYVSLFGEVKLKYENIILPDFPTHKSKALFAKLILHAGHYFSRDSLAEAFWGDLPMDKARKCLRTELWRLRRTLDYYQSCSSSYLLVNKNGICFNAESNFTLDVQLFERKLLKLSQTEIESYTDSDCADLNQCIELYTGDLLESLPGEWCLLRREELRSHYLIVLELLLQFYMLKQNWNKAILFAQQLLSHDALLEHIHLSLMRCYYAQGNRTAAINQYQNCRILLRDELGVSPMQDTEYVYHSIISHVPVADFNISKFKVFKSQAMLVDTVNQALGNLRTTEKLLLQAAEQISNKTT
ncbi:MAG: BTAD domain-containing putative transcriptional regulator [Gammaproteobacteria bacterium]|nr:BTAD domain-containing putative transcriptional regulator [Gammaproteobacteria bacterium]